MAWGERKAVQGGPIFERGGGEVGEEVTPHPHDQR